MTELQKFGQIRRLPKQMAGSFFAAVLCAMIFWLGLIQRGPNFHIVEDGQLYRSGRMSSEELEKSVRQYGLKSVLNLEGARPQKPWYREEVAELDRLHIAHYDFRLSATRVTPPDQVATLLDIIRIAPKPLLVHCRNGVDRSGLASALYLAKLRNRDEDEAYGQLSLAYGHFQYLGSATEEMDDTYWATVDPVRHPD
jgi:protein tyrosine/serine phosphatase